MGEPEPTPWFALGGDGSDGDLEVTDATPLFDRAMQFRALTVQSEEWLRYIADGHAVRAQSLTARPGDRPVVTRSGYLLGWAAAPPPPIRPLASTSTVTGETPPDLAETAAVMLGRLPPTNPGRVPWTAQAWCWRGVWLWDCGVCTGAAELQPADRAACRGCGTARTPGPPPERPAGGTMNARMVLDGTAIKVVMSGLDLGCARPRVTGLGKPFAACTAEEVDDAIDAWHASAGDGPLHAWLGLTRDEYQA